MRPAIPGGSATCFATFTTSPCGIGELIRSALFYRLKVLSDAASLGDGTQCCWCRRPCRRAHGSACNRFAAAATGSAAEAQMSPDDGSGTARAEEPVL